MVSDLLLYFLIFQPTGRVGSPEQSGLIEINVDINVAQLTSRPDVTDFTDDVQMVLHDVHILLAVQTCLLHVLQRCLPAWTKFCLEKKSKFIFSANL